MSSQAGDGRGVYGGVLTQCDPEVDINTPLSERDSNGCIHRCWSASTNTMVNMMRVANLLSGLVLMILGVLCIIDLTPWLGVELICFGLVLFIFELVITSLEEGFRRNLGFLFSYCGRLLFLLFIAIVCFGIGGLGRVWVLVWESS